MRVIEMPEVMMTKLKLLEGYKFNVKFDEESIPDLFVDEIKPIGESAGPNPPRLLFAAVGHCLSSSLIYCLSKARVKTKALETTVKATIARNEEGRQRVKEITVSIDLDVDKKDKDRAQRCIEIFEDFCTVTSSVRNGIKVDVKVT